MNEFIVYKAIKRKRKITLLTNRGLIETKVTKHTRKKR